MNPLRSLLTDAARILHSRDCAGRVFKRDDESELTALMEDVDPVTFGLPLGDDPREQAVLHILTENLPERAIASQEAITDDEGNRWKIVKRIISSAGIDVRYYCVRIVQ